MFRRVFLLNGRGMRCSYDLLASEYDGFWRVLWELIEASETRCTRLTAAAAEEGEEEPLLYE